MRQLFLAASGASCASESQSEQGFAGGRVWLQSAPALRPPSHPHNPSWRVTDWAGSKACLMAPQAASTQARGPGLPSPTLRWPRKEGPRGPREGWRGS